jgi:hypothetical protein
MKSVLVLVTAILLWAAPAFAATCTQSCPDGTSVACTGDTCEAYEGGVKCTTVVNCGPGCTDTRISERKCSGGKGDGNEVPVYEPPPA